MDDSPNPAQAWEVRRRDWLARSPYPEPLPPSPSPDDSEELSSVTASHGRGRAVSNASSKYRSPPSGAIDLPTTPSVNGHAHHPSNASANGVLPPASPSAELSRSPAFGPMAMLETALDAGSREAELAADTIVSKLARGDRLKTRVKLGLLVRCYYSSWMRDGTIPPEYLAAQEPPLEEIDADDAQGPVPPVQLPPPLQTNGAVK